MTQEEYAQEAGRIRAQLVTQARSYLADGDEAEDVVQDALLRLWQMVGQLRPPIEPLARRVVRNLAVSRLRRSRPGTLPPTLPADIPADAEASERVDRMMRIVEQLPGPQQTLLRLRHMEGMETADIAALTGATEAAVRQTLSRARRAVLRQYASAVTPAITKEDNP